MSLPTLLRSWRQSPQIAANIAAWRTFPARPAQTAPLPPELHPVLARNLKALGIESLYTHQATTWQHVAAGHHPVVVTGTASGKTLCYNLPVLHHLLGDPQARALYLFPTKALAHDQQKGLRQLLPAESSMAIAAYDGDTPTSVRPAIREQARLILSNPDMLHVAVLPHHTRWANFLRHLRFVVIDEMHVYRGVFGSHVANVLRRLQRVARFYGASPQFILTSATIANPVELAEKLIEASPALVDNDGAARGAKHFLLYNPPVIDADLGLRRSALQEGVRLSQEFLQQGIQTIIFGRTRRTVELMLTTLRHAHPRQALDPEGEGELIRAYRSGYLSRQRRDIEEGLQQGRVRAVVATSALELGIDIGSLGAAIMVGYPGTIAGAWQQAGRAGRQQEAAIALLIASANPLDQFLAHHPNYFFERTPEQALINPDNLLILLQHLRCAAFELPFAIGEPFGRVAAGQVAEFLEFLQASGDLHYSGLQYFWMADRYPAEKVSLRSASPQTVLLQTGSEAEKWTTIGEVDLASAFWLVHPQAIYLHEGEAYLVDALDLEHYVARLQPTGVDYYTEPKRETTVELVTLLDQAPVRGGDKNYGEIRVTTQIVGYHKIQWFSHERLGEGEVELPPNELFTTGYWLSLAPETVERLREQGVWTNDPNNYGPNWDKQRNEARARDGYRCQICGAPEQGRSHDVHHKTPFRQFASYQQANQLANLVTLCRPCHRRAEAAVQMRSGLSGLATVLGHLAPLFLMCDPHDLGVHADPQSPLAEGRPAVTIYERIPAGIGFSEQLFGLHDRLMAHALELVTTCPCPEGCPSCVGPAGEAGQGGKRETEAILKLLIMG